MNDRYDFIVIGQGLAGTLIGYRLEKAGKSVCYVDAPEQTSASSVAAGIINPITGRRFVKSWRIDELLPEAEKLYTELEEKLGGQFRYELPLVRTLFNRGDQNDWDIRSCDEEYAPYLNSQPELSTLPAITKPAFAYAGVNRSSRIDLARLTEAYGTATLSAKRLLSEKVDYQKLIVNDKGISYGPIKAKAVIFCEGWRARHNPWFSYLPHRGAKGEVLHVRIDAPTPELMFKHRVFLVPRANGTHWIGATTENDFTDDIPTRANHDYLKSRLDEVLIAPYEIADHRAAVRPTVKDRRPLLGVHPDHENLFIFNGLGTKGASLAPLCSRWLADFILNAKSLPDEVNITRFPKK
ncbi:FAD-dependent oxidoreductase [Lewinellaceae bacterium SD302]|nr:FAD-dependent oxidoreductase [Lewinellaceae bacterium SD302]